ncbi:NIPSNAP family protein [Piscinibacter sp.]|uniref:NIPSNAP family protein n=1 Tax=Piscinibacter sp. TaxID=1903157 RepID=UPI002C880FAA|nr:NIPSNAP family protein [Albitalea sp.]HUG25720.1 NIPSNAP family protein [Albitalea sp.]
MPFHDAVIELRQYTLYPGQRDTLIELFEREFVESQEHVGMTVIGTFVDLDNADRFVWLRGFADMAARARALAAFYGSPVWQAHRDAANATMVDSDNVLLLRPADASSGFGRSRAPRAPVGTLRRPPGLVVAHIGSFAEPPGEEFHALFRHTVQPLLAGAGSEVLAAFVTEPGPNDFPRLPVREGEQVFVWFERFADEAAHRRHLASLVASPRWTTDVSPAFMRCFIAEPQVLRLVPTARSSLHA